MTDFFSKLPDKETAEMPMPDADAKPSREEHDLLSIDGVEGYAPLEGVCRVYLRDAGVADKLPRSLDGRSIEVVVTGPVRARADD